MDISSIGEVRKSSCSPDFHNVSLDGNKQNKGEISYQDIATKLLNERLLLTALELHVELCEINREVPVLKNYFSNLNNYDSLNIKSEPCLSLARSCSQATLDSLDMTRYSEDGGGIDERVAVLEFELRKAKENINSLRANLTVVTESEVNSPHKTSKKYGLFEYPIKPHEQRALNFLVNEYLLASSYKLTSITFSEENDNQDFEDWEDVGLNIPKPPELLQIYRDYMRSSGYDKPPSNNISVQTENKQSKDSLKEVELNKIVIEQTKNIEQLKQQIIMLKQENINLQDLSTNTNLTTIAMKQDSTVNSLNSSSTTPVKFEVLESLPHDVSSGYIMLQTEEESSSSIIINSSGIEANERKWTKILTPRKNFTSSVFHSVSRYLPAEFKNEVFRQCHIGVPSNAVQLIEDPLKKGITHNTLINIAARTLPRIVANIILNKREEVIPLLLSVVKLHSNSTEREKLLQILFNLQKRPLDNDRQMILAETLEETVNTCQLFLGLTMIAKLEKEPTDNEEILNLCWEQSQHKYLEHRLLAAECCSALAIYTMSNIRNSLMISMLQQMLLDDKAPEVRVTVVKSLSLLVALMDDPNKYFQCEELALTAMDDASQEVIETACTILVPVLAQWALTLKRLQTHLLPRILTKLKNLLKPLNTLNKDYLDINRATALVTVLRYLLPHTIISVIDTEPVRRRMQESVSSQLSPEFTNLCCSLMVNPKIFYECEVDMSILFNTFILNAWEDYTWPELQWLSEKLIIDLINIIISINITQEIIVNELLTYLQSLCLGFGKYITKYKILTHFKPYIDNLETGLIQIHNEQNLTNLMLIPAYLTVLSTVDSNEFISVLKHFIIILSIHKKDLTGLQIAVVKYCGQDELQEHILSGLWDGVVHKNSSVKCATAYLFGSIISKISKKLIDIRIAPAIVTLANDSDINVKLAAIQVLGKLVTDSDAREVNDKALLTLETIIRESQGVSPTLTVPLVLTLASVAPHCPQNYIEDVIATHLTGIAASVLQQEHQIELINALVEAYSVLVYCTLSNQCIICTVFPGLKHLDILVSQLVPQHKDVVRSLLREIESKKDVYKQIDRSASFSSGLSLSVASVNVGQGVEDMRQRVSKIFHQKTNPSGMSNIFRKK